MTQRDDGVTTIMLDGVERFLVFNYRAFAFLEDRLGINLENLKEGADLFKGGKLKAIPILLQAALLDCMPEVTADEVISLIDKAPGDNFAARLAYIGGKINEAVDRSMGGKKKKAPEEKK